MDCIEDFEKYAFRHLDHQAWAFYSQGAEREETLRDNICSFTRYSFIPRMLRNTAERDLSTTILGKTVHFPVGVAPTGYQKLAHPDGEVASAKAAAAAGILFTLSTVSTTSLEEVSESTPQNSLRWMQLYLTRDKELNYDIIRRAEAAGYLALVLTVDTPIIGLQRRIRRHLVRLPPHLSLPNVVPAMKGVDPVEAKEKAEKHVAFFDTTLSWDDVDWIKRQSSLPIVIKGILTAEDALLAVQHGASAVWVSNHGGRQLDGVPAALDVLPEICAAVQDRCEVYMDGGVRWGSDVLKALALGARAIFVGRPVLWGLAHSGQDGVQKVLEILKTELDKAMHLAGCSKISDIGPQLVRRRYISHI